ncbi:unnamed protein product [Rotaria socialis]|uniref:RRM domain-containing protein n=1 Tax=Rotaria socialis TaxID=392032 RepID=A0A818UUV7_9BILA|nr:unnamed protein product [Rotaria socialis]CAF3463070.1 unnamed protein product [Rotaria socialis]CAF3667752.1 unnamed protein product [Rotaria socialis]CAF3696989.1 unnamed protein product [Rotaria socialis]CAF4324953.1 unnamed protein product [Rotaria socialis]
MEENISSTTLIDISRYCSSFTDGDLWPSSQSLSSQSPVQRLFSPTPTRSTDSDSPVLPSGPLGWPLSSAFAHIDIDPPLWSSAISSSSQHQPCSCCHCGSKTENWSEKLQNRIRSHLFKDEKQTIPPIQRPSPARISTPLSSLNIIDDDDDDDDNSDGTLRLHVSNIPFTWSKEKLAEVFGKFGTTFDVEVVYNERGSKGFGFVTFLAKKDALEAKRRMDKEIVDGRRLVVNFAKPKQKTPGPSKENSLNSSNWKTTSSSDRSHRVINSQYQSLGFSTPPTARRQHLSGFSSLSSTPTRPTTTNNYHRYYL